MRRLLFILLIVFIILPASALTSTVKNFAAPATIEAGGLYRFGPNPYNPLSGQNAIIWYWLEEDKTTNIYIFDLRGNLLRRQGCQAGANGGRAGINSISWDGTNNFGEILENGAYLLKVAQGDKIIYNWKIIILKD